MQTFRVIGTVTAATMIDIEAESAEQAREIAETKSCFAWEFYNSKPEGPIDIDYVELKR